VVRDPKVLRPPPPCLLCRDPIWTGQAATSIYLRIPLATGNPAEQAFDFSELMGPAHIACARDLLAFAATHGETATMPDAT